MAVSSFPAIAFVALGLVMLGLWAYARRAGKEETAIL